MFGTPFQPPRSTLVETEDGIELVVPMRRLGAERLLSASIVLAVWTGAGLAALRSVVGYEEPLELFVRIFLVVCLACWFAIVAVMVASLLWAHFGRERIRFGRLHIDQRLELGPFARSRRYARADVRRLRVMPGGGGNRSHLIAFPFTVRGALVFDHGPSFVTLAEGLDEAEARSIVRLLGERALAHVDPT
jgi:hypothetical protein